MPTRPPASTRGWRPPARPRAPARRDRALLDARPRAARPDARAVHGARAHAARPLPRGPHVLAVERGQPRLRSRPRAGPTSPRRYWRLMRAGVPRLHGDEPGLPRPRDAVERALARGVQEGDRRPRPAVGDPRLRRPQPRHATATSPRCSSSSPGQVWVTEAAGWVAFGADGGTTRPAPPARSPTRSRSRASTARKITRWYFYQWRGVPKGTRWDSGVLGVDGRPRPGYAALKAGLARGRRPPCVAARERAAAQARRSRGTTGRSSYRRWMLDPRRSRSAP